MRVASWVVMLGLWACRPDPGVRHLQNELSFFQGQVDPTREAAEVRRVLAQRRLVVDRQIEGPGFIALGAHEIGGPESAVRVITPRGVVLGLDGALDAPLAAFEVTLADGIATTQGELDMVGVVERPRALDLGCLRLFRVLEDGRLIELALDVGEFGTRACVAGMRTLAGRFFARVSWPGLAAVRVPTLDVELRVVPVLLGREDDPRRTLTPSPDGAWLARGAALFAPSVLAGHAEFSSRHAVGVARAALRKVEGQGLDAQRAAYLGALLPTRAGSPEAAVVADTLAHITRGWLDEGEAPPPGAEPPGGPPEPAPDPSEVVEAEPGVEAPEPPAASGEPAPEPAPPSSDNVAN